MSESDREAPTKLDAVAARRWAEESATALALERDAIDRINVFPVADGDTGTNLLYTFRAAASAVRGEIPDTLGGVLGAMATGALVGARGNSGMLLSQVLRGIAEELDGLAVADGPTLRRALARADALATQAVAEPVAGTVLSVLRAAHEGASHADSCSVVVRTALRAAIRELTRTTDRLPALAAAGVVDAGGRGLVVLFDVLHAVLHGYRLAAVPPAPGMAAERHHQSRYAYEVMYLLSGAGSNDVASLRERLAELGDCVSVAGDGADSHAVHVHCDDIGAAIESGIDTGRVHRISVVRFADQVSTGPALLACVRGTVLADRFRDEGCQVLPVSEQDIGADELVDAIRATGASDVVVMPNDPTSLEVAEQATRRLVREGHEVVVVPTASPVQGLAALAVHDPTRRRADDTIAMAEAAAATRRGELAYAEQEALTWAGRCRPGDVLGLIDDEVVLIEAEVLAAACALADRMLTASGELLTALIGSEAPTSLAETLDEHLRRTHPEVELTSYDAGEIRPILLLGVE